MANFNTHLNIGALITGVAAASLLTANHIELNTALWLWFVGTAGGLLPDIDSDNSASLDGIFNLFALTIIIIVMRFITAGQAELSFLKLLATPVMIYLVMRYVIREFFEKLTAHRGSCHSILFLIFCSLLATQITWLLNFSQSQHADIFAWLTGGFLILGGLIHLLLDEIYSVDLVNMTVKRSFGTALKLADFDNKILTLFTIIAVIALSYIAPPTDRTLAMLMDWSLFKLY